MNERRAAREQKGALIHSVSNPEIVLIHRQELPAASSDISKPHMLFEKWVCFSGDLLPPARQVPERGLHVKFRAHVGPP